MLSVIQTQATTVYKTVPVLGVVWPMPTTAAPVMPIPQMIARKMLAIFGVEITQPAVRVQVVALVSIVSTKRLTLTALISMSVRQIMAIAVQDTAVRIHQGRIPAIWHPVRRTRVARQAVHVIPVIAAH